MSPRLEMEIHILFAMVWILSALFSIVLTKIIDNYRPPTKPRIVTNISFLTIMFLTVLGPITLCLGIVMVHEFCNTDTKGK